MELCAKCAVPPRHDVPLPPAGRLHAPAAQPNGKALFDRRTIKASHNVWRPEQPSELRAYRN